MVGYVLLDFGFFPLPRISLLYKNNSGFSSRIGGGLGYKIPDIFTEEAEYINFENVLAINKSTVDAERSYGVNFDLNYQTRFPTRYIKEQTFLLGTDKYGRDLLRC